ncbi:MAG: hypothetical protein ACE5GK_01450 [Nitrospiria bacterium]
MIYKVRANYREDKMAAFFEKLSDGTILNQKPDGAEIVASMKGAKITQPGTIEWYEICYCRTPLHHERTTVYDFYLTDITTEAVDAQGDIDGRSFWSVLKEK